MSSSSWLVPLIAAIALGVAAWLLLRVLNSPSLPATTQGVRVEVTFEIDTDGILRVKARDQDTGNEQQATMQVVGAPSPQDLTALLEQAPLEPSQTPPELPES